MLGSWWSKERPRSRVARPLLPGLSTGQGEHRVRRCQFDTQKQSWVSLLPTPRETGRVRPESSRLRAALGLLLSVASFRDSSGPVCPSSDIRPCKLGACCSCKSLSPAWLVMTEGSKPRPPAGLAGKALSKDDQSDR